MNKRLIFTKTDEATENTVPGLVSHIDKADRRAKVKKISCRVELVEVRID